MLIQDTLVITGCSNGSDDDDDNDDDDDDRINYDDDYDVFNLAHPSLTPLSFFVS